MISGFHGHENEYCGLLRCYAMYPCRELPMLCLQDRSQFTSNIYAPWKCLQLSTGLLRPWSTFIQIKFFKMRLLICGSPKLNIKCKKTLNGDSTILSLQFSYFLFQPGCFLLCYLSSKLLRDVRSSEFRFKSLQLYTWFTELLSARIMPIIM